MSLSKLSPAWIYICIGLILAMLLSHELDILALGDRTAKSLGMNEKIIRPVSYTHLITKKLLDSVLTIPKKNF